MLGSKDAAGIYRFHDGYLASCLVVSHLPASWKMWQPNDGDAEEARNQPARLFDLRDSTRQDYILHGFSISEMQGLSFLESIRSIRQI
jgi:hypothetical protein